MYRLATKRKKNESKKKFETDNQACTGRVTFCYSLTSWTTELWSVTLNGHAWVDIEFGCVHKLYPEASDCKCNTIRYHSNS